MPPPLLIYNFRGKTFCQVHKCIHPTINSYHTMLPKGLTFVMACNSISHSQSAKGQWHMQANTRKICAEGVEGILPSKRGGGGRGGGGSGTRPTCIFQCKWW